MVLPPLPNFRLIAITLFLEVFAGTGAGVDFASFIIDFFEAGVKHSRNDKG